MQRLHYTMIRPSVTPSRCLAYPHFGGPRCCLPLLFTFNPVPHHWMLTHVCRPTTSAQGPLGRPHHAISLQRCTACALGVGQVWLLGSWALRVKRREPAGARARVPRCVLVPAAGVVALTPCQNAGP